MDESVRADGCDNHRERRSRPWRINQKKVVSPDRITSPKQNMNVTLNTTKSKRINTSIESNKLRMSHNFKSAHSVTNSIS